MTTRFEFVAQDPSAKLKPGKDTLIRSHCMQGKNKRPNSRRSQKEQHKKKNGNIIVSQTVKPQGPLTIPKSPDEFTLARFAWPNIDTESRQLLFKAFAFNVPNPSLTPLDRCVDFDTFEKVTFEWVFSDAAFLHCVLYATHAVDDFLTPGWNGQPGEKTVFHLRQTLRLLNKKIAGSDIHKDEAALNIVVQLGFLAACFGDWCAAIAHFSGLHKIIELRGGQSFLRTRPKLHFKIDRLDLAYSLSSGKQPMFRHATEQWRPTLPIAPVAADALQPPIYWDSGLQSVFLDFQKMAVTVNRYMQSHTQYNAKCFQDVLSSLQSRLLHLEGGLEDPSQELIRLSLLAFLATTFKTPGRKIPYGWIANRISEKYTTANISSSKLTDSLRIWILLITAISVTDVEQPWLQVAWQELSLALDWESVKSELMSVMWIECIHDGPGAVAYHRLADLNYKQGHEQNFMTRPECRTRRWQESRKCLTCGQPDRA
ncbi:hypothetical protein FB567DRAFT_544790 [Paraphoma chrysanthemicola]|uniref:Uncharacterized protein n=1 Tax=Paraphoma chrysanthemicola TaxID=798071 RepID=A0A8K0W2S8_9PLEO|nr:hypothetical protein FB567DRAFT_544790 [Paraphoma chrysanthemicola]